MSVKNKYGTLSWDRCKEILKGKSYKKIAHNTWLESVGDNFCVRLHSTRIITFCRDGRCLYDSGGYRSVTTKQRLNAFGPVHVSQMNFAWYVGGRDFEDGMDVLALPTAEDVDWRPDSTIPEDYYCG